MKTVPGIEGTTVQDERIVIDRGPPSSALDEWVGPNINTRRRAKIASVLGVGRLRRKLGCGHWGCVYAVDAPWVVKITADPTEAPIWNQLDRLQAQHAEVFGGVARVRDVVRLLPDLPYGSAALRVHAIVREAAEPFLCGGQASPTTETALAPEEYQVIRYQLRRYRTAAALFHDEEGSFRDIDESVRRRSATETMQNAAERLAEDVPAALQLGLTLGALITSGIALRDVHLNNIGWRIWNIPGKRVLPEGLIITDPGHSPTEWQPEGIAEYSVNPRPNR
jgi:hypothetical protein